MRERRNESEHLRPSGVTRRYEFHKTLLIRPHKFNKAEKGSIEQCASVSSLPDFSTQRFPEKGEFAPTGEHAQRELVLRLQLDFHSVALGVTERVVGSCRFTGQEQRRLASCSWPVSGSGR